MPRIRAQCLPLLVSATAVLFVLAGCERAVPPPAPAPVPATQSAETRPAALRPLGQPTGTFLDRAAPDVVRVVSYNVKWNSIFPDVSADGAAKFARLLPVLDPDVLALQEIGLHPQERGKAGARARKAEDVVALLNVIAPLPGGGPWHAYQGGDNVLVSRFPLTQTRHDTEPEGERRQAIALVDLPDDRFKVDLYVMNNHFKCCDPEQNDPRRQHQADAIASWIRDARQPGERIELPPRTPILVVGDLNIVGSPRPIETLLTGDVENDETYGPDTAPDWDDSALTDARPLHNGAGPDDWTWRDDNSGFQPGRLDFILYTDSVLEVLRAFALNTVTMTDADLKAAGLERGDVLKDAEGREYDHLPLVVDFRLR